MTATLDSPKDGSVGMAASSVGLDGSRLRLEVNAASASFTGTVDEGKSTITGTWIQGDSSEPLALTRQAIGSK
jgi:GTPase